MTRVDAFTTPSEISNERRQIARRAVALAFGYFLAGQTDRLMGWTASPSVLWPPNAVLLAVLLLAPVRHWWIYALAVLPADLAVAYSYDGIPFLSGLSLYGANTAQSVLAASFVRWVWGKTARFDRAQFVLVFVIAAIAAACVAAFMGAAAISRLSPRHDLWEAWRAWYVANVLTLLTGVPPLCIALLSVRKHDAEPRPSQPRRALEGGLVLVLLALIAVAVYETEYIGSEPLAAFLYVPLPFLLWLALRFGPGLTGAGQVILVLIAIHGAAHGRGPFVTHSADANVLNLQLVLIAMSLPLMFLAAVVRERREAMISLQSSERDARRSHERYREVVEAQTEMVCRYLPDTTLTFVNEAYCRYFGRTREELIGTKFLLLIPEVARAAALAHVQSLIARPRIEAHEHEVQRPDGSIGWQHWIDHVILDADGNPLECQGIGRDVTDRRRAEERLSRNEAELRASHKQIQEMTGRLLLAQEAERTRIARELHDGISQQLAAMSISLSSLRRKIAPTLGSLQGEVVALQECARELSEGVRDLSHELHPGVLQHAGLIAALKTHCLEFQVQNNIETTFAFGDEIRPIAEDISLCLYRVAQEAMHNIVRHASAKRVDVSVVQDDGHLRLTIVDNGCGFDVLNAKLGAGLGLISIEERVRLVRGQVCMDSSPTHGTTLVVQVPVGD